jgi:hypothetical protein
VTAAAHSHEGHSLAGTGEAKSTASTATPSLAWLSSPTMDSGGTRAEAQPSGPTASARMRLAAAAAAPTLDSQHQSTVPTTVLFFVLLPQLFLTYTALYTIVQVKKQYSSQPLLRLAWVEWALLLLHFFFTNYL